MKRQKIKEFFKQDTILLAKNLLGKLILIKKDGKILGGYIVETEAYLGTEDKACHSFEGKRTPKIEALFGEAGTVYIYTMHTHKMLNIVSCEKGNPQAVLIRGIEPVINVKKMIENRGKEGVLVSNGPGKLTKAMGISDGFNMSEIYEIKKNLEKELMFFAKKNAALYKAPRSLEFVAQLPKTHNGKISRAQIRSFGK